MLDVLRHQDLEGVLATVVRYYGGVKLGAGGLVRAYTDSVAQALKTAIKIPVVRYRQLRCQAAYAQEGLIRRLLEEAGADLETVSHADLVSFRFRIPESQAADLVSTLNGRGQGRLQWQDPES